MESTRHALERPHIRLEAERCKAPHGLDRPLCPKLPVAEGKSGVVVYVLVDGENLDGALSAILDRSPQSDDRPRWNKVLNFASRLWGGRTVKPMFFIRVKSAASTPWPFVQCLKQNHFAPVLLTGSNDRKIVDEGIQKTLSALAKRQGDVLLLSHDKDFCGYMESLVDGATERRIAVLAFREHIAGAYARVPNLDVYDLETDANAFVGGPLPRTRPVPIDEFNADTLLDSL